MADSILFFDDSLDIENQLFLRLLRQAVKGTAVHVVQEKTIPHAEQKLKSLPLVVAILDVMAAMPGAPEREAEAGIEVLRRCRAGHYGTRNAGIPIFMRTARGEAHIRQLAFAHGCTNFFSAGVQDEQLIQAIMAICAP
jgi:Response regulator containing CheY-like receiver, AAA-type ATPase, and DNA-binding domains